MPKRAKNDLDVLEKGNIYFFYRPRVEEHQPDSPEDLQNFYLILSPHGKNLYRRAIVGRERMPDPEASGRRRFWGFVDRVEKDPRRLVDDLQEQTYQTKTRGERHQPAARPAGEGIYRLLRHDDHTHLVYALSLPRDAGDVQEDLNIEDEASYVVSIKNPEAPSPPRAGLGEHQADYPEKLQKVFRGRRFADADPPDLLDYPGTEFVLISASGDVKRELGIELQPERESESSARIFRDLGLERSKQPIAPLFEGTWE